MKNKFSLLILVFVIITNKSFSQSIVGQAVYTETQLQEMRNRISNGGPFVSSTGEWFGIYNHIENYAEQFYQEMKTTGDYLGRFTWFCTDNPFPDWTYLPCEPTPGLNPNFQSTNNYFHNETMHYAALISKLWENDSTIITWGGDTKTKAQFSIDIAEYVIDVFILQSQRPELDFWDRTRFPISNAIDSSPMFAICTKFSKYIETYALIHDKVTNYTPYNTNVTAIEHFFAGFADLAYLRLRKKMLDVFGYEEPFNLPGPFNTTWPWPRTIDQESTHFDYNGVPKNLISNAQVATISNRILEGVGVVDLYGLHFNDTAYKNFTFGMFKLLIQFGVFPDGTYHEHYRSGGSGFTNAGTFYSSLSLFGATKLAYYHAVAVENGLPGVTDKGKFFNYTTSIGTNEYYTNTAYPATSTSGGSKNLRLAWENLAKFGKSTSNGGFIPTSLGDTLGRFTNAGSTPAPVVTDYAPRFNTLGLAMANTWYKDSNLAKIAVYDTSLGYNVNSIVGGGPWPIWEVGSHWGQSGTSGSYFAYGLMEDFVFTDGVMEDTLSFCQTSLPVNIDGIEDGSWTTNSDSLSQIVLGAVSNTSDLSVSYKLMWDASNLYILVNVVDDTLISDSPNDTWADDGIEFFIDGDNSKSNNYDSNDKHYIVQWSDNNVYEYGASSSINPPGVTFAQTNTTNGYIIEGAVSWSSIGISPLNNQSIGFEIQVNDDDNGGVSLDGRLGWATSSNPYNDPSLFGNIILDSIVCFNTTSVNNKIDNNVLVYPNPTDDNLTIKSINLLTKVELYNSLGALVLTKEINGYSTSLELNNIPKGIYILKTYGKGYSKENKIIKK